MAKLTDETRASLRRRSRLVTLGRDAEFSQGFVNVPPFRGSTVLYPDVATLKNRAQRYHLRHARHADDGGLVLGLDRPLRRGGNGARSLRARGDRRRADDGAQRRRSSADDRFGLRAVARLRQQTLKRLGVETTYYDPTIGAGIDALMRPNTRAVLTESPGSETLEVQDIPAIAEVAHAHGACVIMDNTWATPLFFSPHAHGVDIAIEAGTKYLSGHADLLLGLVSANEAWFERLHHKRRTAWRSRPARRTCFSRCAACAPWTCGCARRSGRGWRWRTGSSERPEVLRVIHPALPDHPGHALWKRDFSGSSGLFSIVLKPVSEAAVAALLDGLELFGLGYSWGGYESLAVPVRLHDQPHRDALRARRADDPLQRRPRGHRGPEGRPRPGLRAAQGDGLTARARSRDWEAILKQDCACLCGASRFTVDGKPIGRFFCHCTICQKVLSQAFRRRRRISGLRRLPCRAISRSSSAVIVRRPR